MKDRRPGSGRQHSGPEARSSHRHNAATPVFATPSHRGRMEMLRQANAARDRLLAVVQAHLEHLLATHHADPHRSAEVARAWGEVARRVCRGDLVGGEAALVRAVALQEQALGGPAEGGDVGVVGVTWAAAGRTMPSRLRELLAQIERRGRPMDTAVRPLLEDPWWTDEDEEEWWNES